MNISRRWFIGGASSFGALAGCRAISGSGYSLMGAPRLTFGVVSDIHILHLAKPGDGAVGSGANELSFVHALEWFRDQGVDAVVIAGDMADRGLVSQLADVAAAWWRVFPNDRAPDGRKVERLFVYGNHDMGGVPFARYTPDLQKLSAAEIAPQVIYPDPKAAWERVFHEPFEPIWTKKVCGYRFVGAHWWSSRGCKGADEVFNVGIADWYAAHAKEVDPSLPFFHIQHPHPKDTCYGPWAWGRDDGMSTKALSAFPNAVAFSGHSHFSLTDERSIWQGAFTSVGTSAMRYGCPTYFELPYEGFENHKAWGPNARELDGAKMSPRFSGDDCRQGMLWKVYDDCMTVRKREFVSDLDLGEDWVIPLPAAEPKPFAFAEHAKKIGAPAFPAGSAIAVTRVNGKTRGAGKVAKYNKPAIASVMKPAIKVVVPPAVAKDGARVFRYEVEVSGEGGEKVVRNLVPAGYNHATAHPHAAEMTNCVLPLDGLPKGKSLKVAVTPLNCFGRRGNPLTASIAL